jgi:hypothetical protein
MMKQKTMYVSGFPDFSFSHIRLFSPLPCKTTDQEFTVFGLLAHLH